MPVKHWSFAGLMLTYWCNARCASCYLRCDPTRDGWMAVDDALEYWRELVAASPHGCRIHVSGGEPFGDWPRLIELCRRARQEGLGPLEKVETNAFWASDAGIVRQRVLALDEAGMGRLSISADPYHQQFVSIERCRLLARVAAEVLGADRVQVRWQDWLTGGFDTDRLSGPERDELFARYAAHRRDRLSGRAAVHLGKLLQLKPLEEFADCNCRDAILRSRHVHVDADGLVTPGTCSGVVLGRLGESTVDDIWRTLNAEHARRPITAALAESGPVGLLPAARETGFKPKAAYAGKCHLCWEVRAHLSGQGGGGRELGPSWMCQSDDQVA